MTTRLRPIRRIAWILALAVIPGCGDGSPVDVDPAVTPFVGDWSATALVLTAVVNPSLAPDLIELGSTFDLNVQPSGSYRAILIFSGQASTELGDITVSGQTVTLHRRFPNVSTDASIYTFDGPDHLVLEGDTDFDFNLDGTPEAALARFVLVRK